MFNLMKLEFKKFRFRFISKGTIIANLVILGFLVMVACIGKAEQDAMCENIIEWISAINIFSLGTFIVYGATVLAKLVLSEYRTKTIQLMFMYPINRKKLLLAKLMIVYLFTAINVAFSNVFLIAAMSIIEYFLDTVPGQFDLVNIMHAMPLIGTSIIMSGFLAIVPLFFGMRKKSTSHTIVASIIVVMLTCSSSGSISMSYTLVKLLIVGGIAILSFILSVGHMLNNIDNIEMEA